MSKFLKEPLFHFLVLGVVVFVAYAWINRGADGADEIVVTRAQQRNLINLFERTWRRSPTSEEFQGLVQDYVREEIAYREGERMELDRNDIVIRRRLRQKLELLTEDIASLSPPSDDELRSYFEVNSERFRNDARYSFEHIYLSADRRGASVEADAREWLGRVRNDAAAAASLGDPIPLPAEFSSVSESEVASLFGSEFADALEEIAPNEWNGPVRSGFGLHLVRVTDRIESRIPELSEVRTDVMNEVLTERRDQAVEALYEGFARNYTIRVEPLVSDGADPTLPPGGD